MSEIGPTMICPNPIDRKKINRLICTAAVLAFRSSPIDGRAGRYMSIAKGPTADKRPRITAVRRNLGVMTGLFRSHGRRRRLNPSSIEQAEIRLLLIEFSCPRSSFLDRLVQIVNQSYLQFC